MRCTTPVGAKLRSAPILFRPTVSGVSGIRISLWAFDVPQPGRYRLAVDGIATADDASRCAIVFAQAFAGRLVLVILGIVLVSDALIGGLVLAALGTPLDNDQLN